MVKVSPWLVLGLTLLHQVVGVLWYSPWLFAFKWLHLNHLTPAAMGGQHWTAFLVSVLMSLCLIYFLAWLFERLEVQRVVQGMLLSASCWLAFLWMPGLTHAVFAQASLALLCVDLGRDLLVFLLTGFALAVYSRGKQERVLMQQ